MFGWFARQRDALTDAKLAALNRSLGVIEFDLDGTILDANENFLKVMGYTLAEVRGQHHSIFVSPAYKTSSDYRSFWDKLRRGEYDSGEYLRQGKGGREVWIQATYNPILDRQGRPVRVVKFASDITEQKQRAADYSGQVEAIRKSQGMISFTLDGVVLDANDAFLKVLGYSLEEVKGRHHRIFVDPAQAESQAYRDFWAKLQRGEYDAGQYRRVGKGGRDVWIQASYNPILDAAGRPYKVVKFATDITPQMRASQLMRQAVSKVLAAARAHDLTQRIDLADLTGDVRDLCQGINELLNAIGTVIKALKQASVAIAQSTEAISTGSRDMSERTESQAASIEQTAASMHQITATVKQNADNAQAVNQLADSARDTAQRGGIVVQDAVAAVSRIEDSARRISDIVGLIDEIAFQTNLLALNASVEAARAGEAGKGFAVVAQEVRGLAQRSAHASKEIKGLISESNSQVKAGAELVGKTGGSLGDIITSIKRVTDIVVEISAASREQSMGLEQVNTAVTSMDELTQRNGVLIEQNAAAAKALAEQAVRLAHLVDQYQV